MGKCFCFRTHNCPISDWLPANAGVHRAYLS